MAAASCAPHPYCTECGMVKNLAYPRARPLGYFFSGISNLKVHLARSPTHPKLTQSQTHLIADNLFHRPEFEDSYGTRAEAQVMAYLHAVKAIRPDLEDEFIIRFLPTTLVESRGGKTQGNA